MSNIDLALCRLAPWCTSGYHVTATKAAAGSGQARQEAAERHASFMAQLLSTSARPVKALASGGRLAVSRAGRYAEDVAWEGPALLARTATSRHVPPMLFLLGLTVLILRPFLLSDSIPAGTDMFGWLARPAFLAANGEAFSVWTGLSLGEVRQFQLESIMAWIVSLGVEPVVLVKTVIFIGIAGAAVGAYFLAYRYVRHPLAATSAAVIYVNSQVLIPQWTSGHLNLALGLTLAPFVFLALARLVEAPSVGRSALLAALMAVMTVGLRLDVGFYYAPFLGLFVLAHLAFPRSARFPRGSVRSVAAGLGGAVLLYLLFAMPVILPSLLGANPGFVSNATFPLAEHELNSLGFKDTLLGKGRELGYLANADEIWWHSHPLLSLWQYDIVMGSVVAMAVFGAVARWSRLTAFLAVSAVLGVFLAKGPHEPLAGVYVWMYDNLPSFSDLRSPTRWMMFVSLAYALLAALGVAAMIDLLKSRRAERRGEGVAPSLHRGLSLPARYGRRLGYLWLALLLVVTAIPVFPLYADGFPDLGPAQQRSGPAPVCCAGPRGVPRAHRATRAALDADGEPAGHTPGAVR